MDEWRVKATYLVVAEFYTEISDRCLMTLCPHFSQSKAPSN